MSLKSRLRLCLLIPALVSAPLAAQTAYLVEDLVVGRVRAPSDPSRKSGGPRAGPGRI